MKKVACIFIMTIVSLCMIGQTQKGKVRTIERPGKASLGLGDVVVTVIEAPNSVKSNTSGAFSFQLPGKREGDSYTIGSVQKANYVLVDKAVRGRKYGYSSIVPLEIVMVSRQQLEEDKKRIEENATERALKEYTKQKDELVQLRREKRISDEDYAKKQLKLGEDFDKFMSLIDRMAETYALTDCKNISQINKQILQAIENAELEKADSLIRSKGDYDQREKQAKLKIEIGEQEKAIGEKSIREGTDELNDLALDFYHQHTIMSSIYMNDSAAYYLERRANLDSTNVRWQYDLANFLNEFQSDYKRAEKYARQALQMAIKQEGANSETVAFCLNDLANIIASSGRFTEANEMFKKSIAIRQNLYGKQHIKIASCYSNLSTVFAEQEAYDSARVYAEKAMHIRELIPDIDCEDISDSYIIMGRVERETGHLQKAYEYYQRAYQILHECQGENSVQMAELSNSMGGLLLDMDSLDTALSWYERALSIEKNLYGEEHPAVATILDNIGSFYEKIKYHKESYEYSKAALEMRLRTLGTHHPDVGHSYNNIGVSLDYLGEIDDAYEYMLKALELDMLFYGENSTSVANDYSNIAAVLSEKKIFDKALELTNKALDIYTNILGKNSAKVAFTLSTMGDVFYEKKENEQAIHYYLQAIDIYKSLYGENHSSLINTYNNISQAYRYMGDYQKQFEYLNKCLELSRIVYGEESVITATAYSNLSTAFSNLKKFSKAIEYLYKSMNIKKKLFGENSYKAALEYVMLGGIYESMNDYTGAIKAYSSYIPAAREEKGDFSKEVIAHVQIIYALFRSLLTESPTEENRVWFQQFMKDKAWVVMPVDGGVAFQRGMKGVNTLLQYGEWSINGDTTANFLSAMEKVRHSSKHFVVMNSEHQIEAYDFEEATIGVQFLFLIVNPEEKKSIINAWREYKNK